jgi:hypothetical protein
VENPSSLSSFPQSPFHNQHVLYPLPVPGLDPNGPQGHWSVTLVTCEWLAIKIT